MSHATSAVRLFPRRKKQGTALQETQKRRRGASPLVFTTEAISSLFNLSQHDAAEKLGVSATSLKKICRQLGIIRWPYTKKKRKRATPHQLEESDSSSAHGASSCRDSCTSHDSPLLSSCCESEDFTDEEDRLVPMECLPGMAAEVGRALSLTPLPSGIHAAPEEMHEQASEQLADTDHTLDDYADDGAAMLANVERSARRAAQRVGNAAQVRLAPAEEAHYFDVHYPYSQRDCSTDDLHWLVPPAHLQHTHAYSLHGFC